MPSENRFPTSFTTPDTGQDGGAFSNSAWPSASVDGHGGGSTTLSSVNSQRRRASIIFSGWSAPNFGSPAVGYVGPGQSDPFGYQPNFGDTFSVLVQSIVITVRYQFLVNNHDDADGNNVYQIEYSTNGGGGWSTLALQTNLNESPGVIEAQPSASISTSLDFSQFRMREHCDAFTSSGNERCGAVLGTSVAGGIAPRLEVQWDWLINFQQAVRGARAVVMM
jgi:hypothetical protein